VHKNRKAIRLRIKKEEHNQKKKKKDVQRAFKIARGEGRKGKRRAMSCAKAAGSGKNKQVDEGDKAPQFMDPGWRGYANWGKI